MRRLLMLALLALLPAGSARAQAVPHLGEVEVGTGAETVHARAASPATGWRSLRWSGDGRALSAVRTSRGRPVAVSTGGAVVLRLRGVVSAELAPDSSRIALLRDARAGGITLTLRAVGATRAGARRRVLTRGHINGRSSLRWSPDGRRLAVGWETERGWRLVVVASAGLRIVRAEHGRGELEVAPGAWAPDSRRLVYAVDHRTGFPLPFDVELRSLVVGGSGSRRLARPRRWLGEAAWAPAGDRIALSDDFNSLGLMRVAGGAISRTALPDRSELHALAWSPDGASLALAYAPDFEAGIQLAVLDLASGGLRPLGVLGPGAASELAWSPDGARIAYAVSTG